MKNKNQILKMLLTLTIFTNLNILSSNANLLHGYVQKDADNSTSLNNEIAKPDESKANKSEKFPKSNSFPNEYLGTWNCITTVTASSVPIVEIGHKTYSNINFAFDKSQNIIAKWNQPEWTESQSAITSFNNQESQVERTNYYWGENMQGSWATRSKDAFRQVNPNYMMATSEVDQYYQGQYIGRYKTESILCRTTNTISTLSNNYDIAQK